MKKEYTEKDIMDNVWKEIKDIPLSSWHKFPLGGHNLYYFSCPVGKLMRCALTTFTPDLGKTLVFVLYKDDHHGEISRSVVVFQKQFCMRNDETNEFVAKFKKLEEYWKKIKEEEREFDILRFLGKR